MVPAPVDNPSLWTQRITPPQSLRWQELPFIDLLFHHLCMSISLKFPLLKHSEWLLFSWLDADCYILESLHSPPPPPPTPITYLGIFAWESALSQWKKSLKPHSVPTACNTGEWISLWLFFRQALFARYKYDSKSWPMSPPITVDKAKSHLQRSLLLYVLSVTTRRKRDKQKINLKSSNG